MEVPVRNNGNHHISWLAPACPHHCPWKVLLFPAGKPRNTFFFLPKNSSLETSILSCFSSNSVVSPSLSLEVALLLPSTWAIKIIKPIKMLSLAGLVRGAGGPAVLQVLVQHKPHIPGTQPQEGWDEAVLEIASKMLNNHTFKMLQKATAPVQDQYLHKSWSQPWLTAKHTINQWSHGPCLQNC